MSDRTMEVLPLPRCCPTLQGLLLGTPILNKCTLHSKVSGQSERVYGETRYAARKWSRKRRVIMKAEVVRYPGRAPRDNPRFVVTNLPDLPPTASPKPRPADKRLTFQL
jgi:Transposase DDE domain group 1